MIYLYYEGVSSWYLFYLTTYKRDYGFILQHKKGDDDKKLQTVNVV